MMDDIFEEEKSNKPRKKIKKITKIKKDLSKSEIFGNSINSNTLNTELDVPDYLDDFLQHSRGTVFISGNENMNSDKPIFKKKKIIKKVVKKKKMSSSNNNVIINNIKNAGDIEKQKEKEKKEKEEKERKEREEKERKEKEERERKEKEEKERKEREERERKEKEERERKEKEEKERKEKEEREKKEKEEKERKEKEEREKREIENTKKKKLLKIIKKASKKFEKKFNNSPLNNLPSSEEKSSFNQNNNSSSDNNFQSSNNKFNESSNETPSKNISLVSKDDTEEKGNITSSENTDKREITEEEESEITDKISEKNRVSVNDSNEVQSKTEEDDEENEQSGSDEEENEENEDNEEEEKVVEYENKPQRKESGIKKNLKEQLEKFENEQKELLFIKFNNIIHKTLFKGIINLLKSLIIFEKIKNYHNKCITKISSAYRGYSFYNKFKLDYITLKILNFRKECAFKIFSYYKMYLDRKRVKNLLIRKKNNYIIYSSLSNNKLLYFKYRHLKEIEENLNFEYCNFLNCFIFIINKRDKNNIKTIEGRFYNENYNMLLDPMYETNEKGENIINFQEIFKKEDAIEEKNNMIKNRYIRMHKPVKRERIDDYEERKKKKAFDDDHLSKSPMVKHKKIGDKIGEMSRSKSFIKLKTKKGKGILKPSKSYMNLRCVDKKIHFGNARIKKYHNLKK